MTNEYPGPGFPSQPASPSQPPPTGGFPPQHPQGFGQPVYPPQQPQGFGQPGYPPSQGWGPTPPQPNPKNTGLLIGAIAVGVLVVVVMGGLAYLTLGDSEEVAADSSLAPSTTVTQPNPLVEAPPAPAPTPTPAPQEPQNQQVALPQIQVGDCFLDPKAGSFATLTKVDCSSPHEWEAFHVVEYPEGTDYDNTSGEVPTCRENFEPYVGSDPGSSSLTALPLVPDRDEWNDPSFRRYVCVLISTQSKTESSRGTGR